MIMKGMISLLMMGDGQLCPHECSPKGELELIHKQWEHVYVHGPSTVDSDDTIRTYSGYHVLIHAIKKHLKIRIYAELSAG